MSDALIQFSLYTGEVIITVIAILAIVAGIAAIALKHKSVDQTKLSIRKLNEYYNQLAEAIFETVLNKKERKKQLKQTKKELKARESRAPRRIFVLNFEGDLKASAVSTLREEITAILNVATAKDEVFLRLESTGGVMHGYGLAASELQRIKNQNIPLTISIDKVAASGGYMMACVADTILAAPFAIIGSIGVLAQIPNFHRLLKKHDVDFEQISAGQYKRTLSLFGENTREGRTKFQEEINDAHELFKEFIKENRPQVDIDKVATGEFWFAKRALKFFLIDKITTSDDYLLAASKKADLFEIQIKKKKKLLNKLELLTKAACKKVVSGIREGATDEEVYP